MYYNYTLYLKKIKNYLNKLMLLTQQLKYN